MGEQRQRACERSMAAMLIKGASLGWLASWAIAAVLFVGPIVIWLALVLVHAPVSTAHLFYDGQAGLSVIAFPFLLFTLLPYTLGGESQVCCSTPWRGSGS
jgi:hypothetical protein